jgi:hypothetical protein
MGLRARAPFLGRKVKLFAPAYVPGGGIPVGATFTRNLEGAQTAADGSLSFVLANVLREAHYIGGVRTALFEPVATNLVNQNFSDASWLTFSQAIDVINFRAGADGVANARRIAGSGQDAQIYMTTARGVDTFTMSYYALSLAAGNSARVGMYGTPASNNYSSPAYPASFALDTVQWRRLVWAVDAVTALSQYGAQSRGGGFASPEHYISGAQLEVGPNATSVIRTAGGTRPVDLLTFPQSGTIYLKMLTPAGVLQEIVRAYVAGTSALGLVQRDTPRGILSIKLGLGTYTLAEMRAAV